MVKKTGLSDLFKLFASILVVIAFSSCGALDREEDTPSYLRIGEFNLNTPANNSKGSNAHDIVDAWVYVGGQYIGTFELPAVVPVLASGNLSVTISPGIKKNGASNNRVAYPFYESYLDTINLVPGETYEISPEVEYFSAATFPWIEDFEDRSISLIKSGTDVTSDSIQLTIDPLLVHDYGDFSKVSAFNVMDTGFQKFENSTISDFDLPRNQAIYLEMNYNLETNMQMGMYAYNDAGDVIGQFPVLFLFATEGKWKKAYISLSEDVNTPTFADATFKIFFEVQRTSSEPTKNYFDNLKIVHF
jgi:hypothetical protein